MWIAWSASSCRCGPLTHGSSLTSCSVSITVIRRADSPAGSTCRFGQSFGGAQSLQFCRDDLRCKAGIDIDGAPYGSVVQEGLKQLFMIILSDHSREMSDPAGRQIAANLESVYRHLPNSRLFVVIRGANHFSFSDHILLKSRYVIWTLQRIGFGDLPPRCGLAITRDYVHTFFDVYLKQTTPASALNQLSTKYPEVRTETP